ncbi:MAG TPA: hypothetical protein DCY88_31395 [Cyanobacteria bacterium UBA11372]|nr:hypothetical protein [Cyanobacteria bacterium UBA11372]
MIHHISIPAENPVKVAHVLSELWNGQFAPFYPYSGSYVVFKLDDSGTLIEIYPLGTELLPGTGDQQVGFTANPHSSAYSATHAAISTVLSEAEILAIANREGWRALRCSRDGFFDLIEFWVENRLLLELLPPDIVPKYLAFMQPRSLQKFLLTVDS